MVPSTHAHCDTSALILHMLLVQQRFKPDVQSVCMEDVTAAVLLAATQTLNSIEALHVVLELAVAYRMNSWQNAMTFDCCTCFRLVQQNNSFHYLATTATFSFILSDMDGD